MRGPPCISAAKPRAGAPFDRLSIVESRCDSRQVRQQAIVTVGRFEKLQASSPWPPNPSPNPKM
jgi:hypothetical protein